MSTSDISTDPKMNLLIVNPDDSGVDSSKIHVSILGTKPGTDCFGYLDFVTGEMVATSQSQFSYVPGTTSKTLKQIQEIGGPVHVPPMESARIYFAINNDFNPSLMVPSGPTASADNKTLFDKIEFDTSSDDACNINGTCVDFYGISYTITATPVGQDDPVTVGFDKSRTEIIGALNGIPHSCDDQHSGNTNIFKYCMMKNDEEVLRVLSPKAMALTDWGGQDYVRRATLSSHFLDDYVNTWCWKPNRKFCFYDKDWPAKRNEIYGAVNADGYTLNLYTDEARTNPYTVPSLPRPSACWPLPSFQDATNYHNTHSGDPDGIDWGFLLIGNARGEHAGAHWASDPAAIAIMVSIDRGVMHLDNGTTDWVDRKKYYRGDGNGKSTRDKPIFFYSSILHQLGHDCKAYALSYDDVYGEHPAIFFKKGANVQVTLNHLESVMLPTSPDSTR